MYTVKVEKECSCFKQSDFKNNTQYDSRVDALMNAMQLSNKMNNKFCKKHNFIILEKDETFLISMGESKGLDSCCGDGCCI